MGGILTTLVQEAIGIAVRRRSSIFAASSSMIRWSKLWGTRGGTVAVGEYSIVNCKIAFDSSAGQVRIGRRCYIGASLLVCHSAIDIEDDVIISWGVTIVDHDSHALDWSGRSEDIINWAQGKKCWDNVTIRPVHIGQKVWIGFGASILKGVKIGEGAVVGAGSVVTCNVPSFAVVAGNPARVVRKLNSQCEENVG